MKLKHGRQSLALAYLGYSALYIEVKRDFDDGENLIALFRFLVVVIDKIELDTYRCAPKRLVGLQGKFQL